MRIADEMGIEIGEDGSVTGPGADVVVG
jgi:(E)-4-hydroxy-3-methylbut-2-enyl-diphosphate synthase